MRALPPRAPLSVLAAVLAAGLLGACCKCAPAPATAASSAPAPPQSATASTPAEPAAPPPDPAVVQSAGTASAAPPGGLKPNQVPQFVVLGFDDNGISGMPGSPTTGGIRWVVEDLFAGRKNTDGSPALASFYVATRYLEAPETDAPEHVKRALRAAADAGHEIALHTHTHPHGAAFGSAQWGEEIATCSAWLEKPFDAARAADP